MNIELLPLAAFVLIATFTPGPGNITSAAMGMMYGFTRSLPFLAGIVSGYLLIMVLCAFLSTSLLKIIPTVEPILRLIGASYILWLAIGTIRTKYNFSKRQTAPMNFRHGFFLQALNPKAIIFGLTIYTTFLSSITEQPFFLTTSTLILAIVTFCSVSLWTYTGVRIQNYLHSTKVQQIVNLTLGVLLAYCALSISGISLFR